MNVRRALAFGAVVVASFASWIPAAHADTPTGAWTDPAPNGQYQGAPVAYLQRAQPLKGSADFRAGSIANVSFTLVQDAPNTAPTDPCSAATTVKPQTAGSGGAHVDFAFDAPFPCNRRYEVRATITPARRPLQNDTPALLNLWVAVAIPPAPTAGLTAAAISGDDRGVKLSWAAAPHEPDFLGYQVRRAIGNGSFEPVADAAPGATSWTDHRLPHDGATLRYQVVGMRPGPDPATTVFADAGPVASATVPAAVDAPGGAASSGDGSGATTTGGAVAGGGSGVPTGKGVTSVHREYAAPGSHTAVTVDGGYDERLPFKPHAGGAGDAAAGSAVARYRDGDGGGDARQRALLVGGAAVAFSWAMLLRLLTRRALVY